jgi:hypothetical protein
MSFIMRIYNLLVHLSSSVHETSKEVLPEECKHANTSVLELCLTVPFKICGLSLHEYWGSTSKPSTARNMGAMT